MMNRKHSGGFWIVAGNLLVPLILLQGHVFAEDEKSAWPSLTENGTVILQDYRNFYSGKNLGMMGLGLGIGGILANTNADRVVDEWYQDSVRSGFTDDLSENAEYMGRALVAAPLFAGAVIVGRLMKEKTEAGSKIQQWGENSLRSLLVGGPPAFLLQYALGGSRPEDGSSHWRPFQDSHGVSGHSFIGAIPFIVAAKMTRSPYWKVPLYLASTLVGLARINDDEHYPSQVALGWWMACLSADCVMQTEAERRRVLIVPSSSRRSFGFQVVFRY